MMCSRKEKETLSLVIDKYKEMPYLWKKDHKDYLNKDMRQEGFTVLLEIYKRYYTDATIKILKKKIENLRTNYGKEMKKVLASKYAGDGAYVPTLWYFDALSFLSESCYDVSNLTNSFKRDDLASDDEIVIVTASSSGQKRTKKEERREEKKRRLERGFIQETPEKLVTNVSNNDQWEVYGRSIGYQMKDLDEHQLVICQKLISDAIFYAKINKLNEHSHIVTPSNDPIYYQQRDSPLSTYSSPTSS